MTKHLRYLFAALLVWICTVGGYAQTTVTDEITWSGLGLNKTNSNYSNFSSKKFVSTAEYSGNASSGSGKYIQLRTSKSSGIVTTASGGNLKEIKIEFNTSTSNNRAVDIYGSNTAYGGFDNLFNSTSAGTKIGTATKTSTSTSTTIQVTDSYKYIGIRSNDGALYINKITIVWETSSSSLTSTTTSFGDNSKKTFNFVKGVLDGFTAPVATAKAGDTDITSQLQYSSSAPDIVTVANDGTLTFTNTKFGTAEIKAEIVKGDTYDNSSDTYTVVNSEPAKTATSLSFGADKDGSTVALTEGLLSDGSDFTGYTATESTGADGTISYAATGDGVATVDATTGALTVNKTTYGTTTITATFTPNDAETYAASTATYKITNKMDAVFYESFDKCAKDGGNDGKWSSISTSGDIQTDVEGWNFSQGNAASKCARFGTGGKKGSATTPSITLTTGVGLLSFTAAAWKGDVNRIQLTASNGTLTYNGTTAQTVSVDLQNEKWTDFTNIAISATGPFTIKFEAGTDKNNRFFLDEVAVKQTKAKLDPQLSFAEATQTKQMENGGITVPLQTVTKAEGLDAEIKYSLNCESSVAEISGTGILVYKAATIVVTATSAETDNYKAGTASYTLNVTEQRAEDAAFKFDAESYEIDMKDAENEFDALGKLTNPHDLTVTWAITPSNGDQVMIDNGDVVVYKCGTYTITATGAANDSYLETTATCQLVVKDRTLEEKYVTFVAGTNMGTQTKNGNVDEVAVNPVAMVSTNAAFAASSNGVYTYRFYSDSETEISTKAGNIVKIEFVGSGNTDTQNSLKQLSTEVGEYSCNDNNHGVWEGLQKNVTFTASAATYATQIIVTLELPKAKDYSFFENDATITLEDYENANVTIDRKLEADGGWWTLCLPFALDADQMKTYFGDGAQLRTFDSMNGTTMNFKAATEMEAGKPYLVKPTKNFDGTTTTFECVQLKAGDPATLGTGYAMIGTYHTETLATTGTDLFLGANNKFYKPSEGGNTIKGFRVYFQCPADKVGTPMTANIDGVETAITRIDGEQLGGTTDTRVYNLQGQCVGNTLRGLASGIYVCGGRKVVVK